MLLRMKYSLFSLTEVNGRREPGLEEPNDDVIQ